ncbi:response regulator [Amycolatopsis sacchari]|uniref:response regulator n=1 Tax=Amycolatopsis sacchari TaxID=115433 RepID=UPI003EB71271
MIRLVIADDQALVRLGLRVLLRGEPDLQLVGEASDGDEALALIRRHRPDVVLMDVRMPGLDGIAALRLLAADAELADVRVVMLTTFEVADYVFDALAAGAAGFLLKDADPTEILRGIRVAAAGDSLLSPAVTRMVIAKFAATAPGRRRHAGLDTLTPREREVVGWVAAGLSNDEIAAKLVLSAATVRTHISRAMTKTGARDRTQLVVFAYQSGMPVPGT